MGKGQKESRKALYKREILCFISNCNDSSYFFRSVFGEVKSMETKYARKGSAVYAALASTKAHPSADTLYQELRKTYPNISRTTVYANLSRLREEGSVICVGVVNGRERYDAVTYPHPHFICSVCGAVLDVEGLSDTLELDREAEAHNPVHVDFHELTFRGVCRSCSSV